MDEFACIRSFITVVEAGSFSAAARRGNVSTSAVASMVKWLEDELGVRLLNRHTRHQSLTEVGLAFYDRVRAIANDLAMAKGEAQSQDEASPGCSVSRSAPPPQRRSSSRHFRISCTSIPI